MQAIPTKQALNVHARIYYGIQSIKQVCDEGGEREIFRCLQFLSFQILGFYLSY